MRIAAEGSLRQESINDMTGDFLLPLEELGRCAVMAVTLCGGEPCPQPRSIRIMLTGPSFTRSLNMYWDPSMMIPAFMNTLE